MNESKTLNQTEKLNKSRCVDDWEYVNKFKQSSWVENNVELIEKTKAKLN